MLTDAKIAAIKPPASGQQEHPDHKVTGLRLRVGSGGKKTWTLRRRVGDKVINRKLGNYPGMGLAAARKAAEAVLEAIERDGSTEALERTFGAVAAHWLANEAKGKNKGWREQERRLELHVLPSWRDRKIAEIRRGDVRELIGGIEGEVLPNRVLAAVRRIFNYALEQDWLAASPAQGVKAPKAETARDRVLDMAEIARIWRSADLLGYPAGAFFRLLILTGQRRTEVASMRWADLDQEGGVWTLPASSTKAARAHVVPLPAAAAKIIEGLPELGPFALTSDGETHFQHYSKAKSALDKFIAATGDPLEPWNIHDIRRSVATHAVRLGASVETVSRLLNHAAAGVTRKVYALHDFIPEKRHALDTWAAEINRAVNGERGGNVVKLERG